MACEIDIFEAANVSATSPDDNDLLLFFLPDKSAVFRTWANVKTTLVPDDINWLIDDGPHEEGMLHSGEGHVTLPQYIGFRVRVLRNGINQMPFAIPNGTYYTRDIATGDFDVTPALQKTETFQIQPY